MRLVYLLVKTGLMYCVSGYTITQLSWLMYSGNKRWGNLVSYPGPPPLAVHKTAPESKGNEKHGGAFYNWFGWKSGHGSW